VEKTLSDISPWFSEGLRKIHLLPAILTILIVLVDINVPKIRLQSLYDFCPPQVVIRNIGQIDPTSISGELSSFNPSLKLAAPDKEHTHLVLRIRGVRNTGVHNEQLINRIKVRPANTPPEVNAFQEIYLFANSRDDSILFLTDYKEKASIFDEIREKEKDREKKVMSYANEYISPQKSSTKEDSLRFDESGFSYTQMGYNINGEPYAKITNDSEELFPFLKKKFTYSEGTLYCEIKFVCFGVDGGISIYREITGNKMSQEVSKSVSSDELTEAGEKMYIFAEHIPDKVDYCAVRTSLNTWGQFYTAAMTLVFVNVPLNQKFSLIDDGRIVASFKPSLKRFSMSTLFSLGLLFILLVISLNILSVRLAFAAIEKNVPCSKAYVTVGLCAGFLLISLPLIIWTIVILQVFASPFGELMRVIINVLGVLLLVSILLAAGIIAKPISSD
jgi:hypothetical protein